MIWYNKRKKRVGKEGVIISRNVNTIEKRTSYKIKNELQRLFS